MKSLVKIQQEVRKLEKTAAELQTALGAINADIDRLRSQSRGTETDYEALKKLAAKLGANFGQHPLAQADERPALNYLKLLLNVVRLDFDSKLLVDRLAFICWMLEQSPVDVALEDLVRDTMDMDVEFYHEAAQNIEGKFKKYLMVDAFILANLGGLSNRDVLKYLAALSDVLHISKENVEKLAQVAQAILCRSLFSSDDNIIRLLSFFDHYRNAKGSAKPFRCLVAEFNSSVAIDLKWNMCNCTKVQPGFILVSYRTRYGNPRSLTSYTLNASIPGVFFHVKSNGNHYCVITQPGDTEDAVRSWVDNELKKKEAKN